MAKKYSHNACCLCMKPQSTPHLAIAATIATRRKIPSLAHRTLQSLGFRFFSLGHKAYHGFTLVELLVVVAIISVLAAFLLPILWEAREAARRALCLSNLQQMYKACLLYLGDNNETFMRQGFWRYGVQGHFVRNDLIDGYGRTDFWNYYRHYLGGKIESNLSYNPPGTTSDLMRKKPLAVVCCPNRRQSDWWWGMNAYFTGSANNFRLTIDKLQLAANRTNIGSPAIFGDSQGENGGANYGKWKLPHQKNGINLGGNVVHLDGSGAWYHSPPNPGWQKLPLTKENRIYTGWGGTGWFSATSAVTPSYEPGGEIDMDNRAAILIGWVHVYWTGYPTPRALFY